VLHGVPVSTTYMSTVGKGKAIRVISRKIFQCVLIRARTRRLA
jgi:hypothetical protein